MDTTYYSAQQFYEDVPKLASLISQTPCAENLVYIHGVPQGGTVLATALAEKLGLLQLDQNNMKNKPPRTVLVVDDIVDSGKTRERYRQYPFACLHVAPGCPWWCDEVPTIGLKQVKDWIVYWWEGTKEKSINDTVIRQLEFIQENPTREGLRETPDRVVRSWEVLYGGYRTDPLSVFRVFEDDDSDEMVLLKDIEFYSTCEHHMLPFFGRAHIAYIPDGKVVGISKLARLLEVYARRLQIQERLGQQITHALMTHLKPKGAACILEAQHFCMTARGVQKQNSKMVTSSLEGAFREDARVRMEFLELVK